MKRSSAVQIGLLATLAATLVSCSRNTAQRCVDSQNIVVDERYCRDSVSSGYTPYHWYYGGTRGYAPIGSRMSGGSTVAPSPGTSRGIFGGTGSSHGGGVSS
jgi:hypothetical protein